MVICVICGKQCRGSKQTMAGSFNGVQDPLGFPQARVSGARVPLTPSSSPNQADQREPRATGCASCQSGKHAFSTQEASCGYLARGTRVTTRVEVRVAAHPPLLAPPSPSPSCPLQPVGRAASLATPAALPCAGPRARRSGDRTHRVALRAGRQRQCGVQGGGCLSQLSAQEAQGHGDVEGRPDARPGDGGRQDQA